MAIREEKYKTHRIIQIERSIRNGEYPSIQKLADYHEVSIRTIKRDIEFLRDRYTAPIEYDKNRNGYYYTDSTFMIQNVLLTEGDLFTVSTIMPLMEQYKNTPLENSFKNIMEKVSEMLPDQVDVNTSFLNKDISFISDPLPKIESEVFETIFKSIKLRKTIEFEYRSVAKTEYTNKKIDCYKVICQKGNCYVLGLSHNKNEIRIYALSRMQNVELTNDSFEIPQDFDLNNYVDLSFGIWNNKHEPVEYELLFSPQINTYVLEREWHTNQTVEQKEDGSVLLKFKSNQKQQVLSWVLSFGNVVKVINPPELIEKVKEEIKNIAKMYE